MIFIFFLTCFNLYSNNIKYINPKKYTQITENKIYETIYLKRSSSKEIDDVIKKLNKDILITSYEDKIILYGNKSDIEKIKSIIDKLDTYKKEIEIRINIIDMSNNLLDRIGAKWRINTDDMLSLVAREGIIGLFDALDINISALKENGELSYKSMPSIKVIDGDRATLKLTQESIFKNSKSSMITREAGLILNVEPKITKKGILTKINIEFSNFADDLIKNQNLIDTTILLLNSEKKIIASSKNSYTDQKYNKTPVLSDFPFIGSLFKYKTKTNTQREVYIEIEAIINEWFQI